VRLIDVQDEQQCPTPLLLRAGDVVLFHASGARVRSGADVVEVLGSFNQALIGLDGTIMAPSGAPNAVLLRTRKIGDATVDLFAGDPWHSPRTKTLVLKVEPSPIY
jgi:hypothetical protein